MKSENVDDQSWILHRKGLNPINHTLSQSSASLRRTLLPICVDIEGTGGAVTATVLAGRDCDTASWSLIIDEFTLLTINQK
jgi:hypothetical protein